MPTFLGHLLRGYAMGTADLIPGVSGGTVALVLGIYRRLVAAIRTGAAALGALARFDPKGFLARLRTVEWAFFMPLVTGIGLAVVTLSRLIGHLLTSQPVRMAALFFGLVAGSTWVAWRLLHRPDPLRVGILVTVAATTFVILGLRAGPVASPEWWMFLGSGAIAICAMILPGISGSFLLLMMGMYEAVLGAVNQGAWASIALFALGAVVGLASFSTLLHLLLDRYHDTVMAAMVGLMAGSLRVLWPWPEGTGGTSLTRPQGDVVVPVLLALAGTATVVAIARRERALRAGVEAAADEAAEAAR